ncbi:FYVE/PHD zinc finger [Glarea lozoyensis ATCC 20868]|uniref:FYVE/PHD zinc finger n=1 Tax=Glarea lozoyensis (strain ATCC 20868 / MF5171) TaxID=1116229 RepID=S3D604_GLAL2|nr:FYVE/PHD zinc finger [Glarea lozoyensis ATCC 20868]EPE32564.1 FYVE/PHD zinc finger [Glarea lozoyensis ATCC 20868]
MVSSRKRGRQEMEAVEPTPEPPKEITMLDRIRNMWEFAALTQYIFTFGRAVKIDENLDTEELEMACLTHHSTILRDIGLALLKFVSSHKGLTPEIFDEYTRRQYVARAPERNPFGVEEEPAKFLDFDTFTKIRVLQQLTQWTMVNPDRIRDRMEEKKDTEQAVWRIEPFGWDSEDRTYILLDDNRLYRQTEPPPPPAPTPKPKKNSKKAKAAQRASKRRKVAEAVESETEAADESMVGETVGEIKEDDGLGGMKWECIAVSYQDYTSFLATIEKSRDPNEKILWKRLSEDVLPILEKQEEARQRKAAQKARELQNLEKLATAKRSSRIAGKMEMQKHEEETREAERKRLAELSMAKKEQEKWLKLEKERESRMVTREQRLKEREARRILHEEELANLSEDSKKIDAGAGRLSERHLKAEIEKKKQALEELAEEEDWIFDCICGAYGQIDDGTHSIACDKCNIWQHSKCVGVSQKEAERDDFSFICKTCQRRAEDAERAKNRPPIMLKLGRPGSSSSPAAKDSFSDNVSVVLPAKLNGNISFPPSTSNGTHSSPVKSLQTAPKLATWQPGSALSPQGRQSHDTSIAQTPRSQQDTSLSSPRRQPQSSPILPPNHTSRLNQGPLFTRQLGSSSPNSKTQQPFSAIRPSSAHAFSSPHPNSPTNLPPPNQPAVYTFMNGNGMNHNKSVANPNSSPSRKTSGSPPLATMALNGSRSISSDSNQDSRVFGASSPFAGGPVLTPAAKTKSHTETPLSNKPQSSAPNMHVWKPAGSSPLQTMATPANQGQSSQNQIEDQSSALPSAASGLSPTKHSPPRSFSSSFGSHTPSILPPVATLSPNFQKQILTPPVKVSDPERNRPNGQASSPAPTY